MSKSVKNITIATVGILTSLALNTYSQDRQVLSSDGSCKRPLLTRIVKPKTHRTVDQGNALTAWRDQVVYRAKNNTNVYQYRGNATTRHDEVSSNAVIFRARSGYGVTAGHAYQKRGN